MSWLANRRRGVEKSLPYDAEVEYLYSTNEGKQYVDTGIKASGNLVVRLRAFDYFINPLDNGQWLFGGRNAYNQKGFGLFIDRANFKVYLSYGNTTQELNNYQSYPSSADIYIDGNGDITIGNTTHSYSKNNFVGDYNIFLFGLNNGGSKVGGGANKIGKVYISNGIDTIDCIPVRKNGVGYFYDKINNRLIGDVNDVGFGYGNDV